jgi:hypothetical protein
MTSKTRKNKPSVKNYLRDWDKEQPSLEERPAMMKKCGKKCFLGIRDTFPICSKNTCKVNKKGVYSALVKARAWETIATTQGKKRFKKIATKAKKILEKMK